MPDQTSRGLPVRCRYCLIFCWLARYAGLSSLSGLAGSSLALLRLSSFSLLYVSIDSRLQDCRGVAGGGFGLGRGWGRRGEECRGER
jgi:hypothetical protein